MQSRSGATTPAGENGLFDGGPPVRLEGWLHLRRPGRRGTIRQALLAATVAWAPLALLTALQGDLVHAAGPRPFLLDIAVHARFLVALPALILAESLCIPRLDTIARHFVDSGLLADADRPRFDAAVASTRRLRDSTAAEIAVVLIAYTTAALLLLAPARIKPEWYASGETGLAGLSLAAWWHTFVSLPLLLMLALGWIWRVALWARFLWLTSRLDLRLLPSHPDRAGGLRFAGHSLRAFTWPAFGLGAIGAGAEANAILHANASLLSSAYAVLGLAVFVLVLFASPLLAFSGKLLAHWHRGVREYGTLAHRVGRELERTWLEPDERSRREAESPLESPAFSATADLYQVVSNAYEMRLVPIDVTSLVLLLAATLLPFLPVLLLVIPFDELVERFAGFLL